MHTKQQIRELLEIANLHPRHKWGQNFLIDLNLMRLLVNAAGLKGNEVVLEVGCGTGSMTDLLSSRAGKVIAVDIDPALMEIAKSELANRNNIYWCNTDIIKGKNTISPDVCNILREIKVQNNLPPTQRHTEYSTNANNTHHINNISRPPFYLIANLPYQISSPLLVNLLLGRADGDIPDGIFITIQAEVAQRITALPGTKAYGLLSIMMQATGSVERLRTIKPQSFWPSPAVNSAMIVWRRDTEKCRNINDISRLKQLIEVLLGQRRKKISTCLANNNLKATITPLLEQLQVSPDIRGEKISVETFVQLANMWT